MNGQKSEFNGNDLACPMCRCDKARNVAELSGKQIRALWSAYGTEFSEDALCNFPETIPVILYKCRNCEFSFFDPTLAGNELFYRHLDRNGYYSPTRPEFARSLKFAAKNKLKRILDVGCGGGAFLDIAKQRGHQVCGIELNRVAATKARSKGHVVFEHLLHDLDQTKTGGGFDLITFFQVLEHVSDPVRVMKDAGTLLNPNGFISVAVPSASGIYRIAPHDPHQWPPHHISRWRIVDFRKLAHATDLKLNEVGGDILLGTQIEHAWNLQNQLAPAVKKRKRWGGKTLPKVVSFAYRKAGLKYVFPNWGYSIYGYFQKI